MLMLEVAEPAGERLILGPGASARRSAASRGGGGEEHQERLGQGRKRERVSEQIVLYSLKHVRVRRGEPARTYKAEKGYRLDSLLQATEIQCSSFSRL